MRKIFLVLAFFGTASACNPPSENEFEDFLEEQEADVSTRASAWMPLQAGNEWQFVSQKGGLQRTVKVTANRPGVFKLEGVFDEVAPVVYATPTSSMMLYFDMMQGKWVTMLKFASTTRAWKFSENGSPCETYVMTPSNVKTPLYTWMRTFTSTRSIDLTVVGAANVRCAAPKISNLTFSPGLGLVAFTGKNQERYLLKKAFVNGTTYLK